jgi:DNA-binding response OmpR family regulator
MEEVTMNLAQLRDPVHLVTGSSEPERTFAELQVVRRRLDRIVVELMEYCQNLEARSGWEEVTVAAQTALRAVQAGLAAAPNLPFAADVPIELEGAVDDLTYSVTSRRAWWMTTDLRFTTTEFALFLALARDPQRVFTKAELLRDVWGYRSACRTRTLDSHASRVRKKLALAGAPDGRYVVCMWGVGYSLMRP